MIQKPLISVCIPAFNAEKTLIKCVTSILDQKYENCEVIIVDDGSVDNTPNICSDLVANYANVFVFHQENRGQAAARSRAVSKAKGRWILFLDSDDEHEPDSLRLLSTAIEKTDAEIIFFDCTDVDFAGNKTLRLWPFPSATAGINQIPKNDVLVKFLSTARMNGVCRQIVKADLANAALKDENAMHIRYGEDVIQNISLYSRAETFAYLRAPICLHIENSESVTHNIGFEKYWADTQEVRKAVHEFALKVPLKKDERIEVERGMFTNDANGVVFAVELASRLPVARAKESFKSIRASTLFQGVRDKRGLKLSWRRRITWIMLLWHLDSLRLFCRFLRDWQKSLKNLKPSKK